MAAGHDSITDISHQIFEVMNSCLLLDEYQIDLEGVEAKW